MIQNKKTLKVIPLFGAFVLCACSSVPAERVTYDLLWGTKIEKLENHVVVDQPSEGGIITIHKEINGKTSDDFKVLMFTDTHLDHKRPQCNYTFTMIAKNIMAEKPDLVIFCGDNITSIENEPRARQFCQMLENLNVYWSCCLGNHEGDPKGNTLTRPQMIKLFSSFSHCLLDPNEKKIETGMTVYGNGNSAINILNSNGKVAQTLFFLDTDRAMSEESMNEYAPEIKKFIEMNKAKVGATDFADYIHSSQIDWYKETIAKSKSVNSVVFSHVPLGDMEEAYIGYYNTIKKTKPEWSDKEDQGVGSTEKIWPYTIVPGETEVDNLGTVKLLCGCRAEEMCYGPHDLRKVNGHTPMFNAMKESGGIHPAFFCGHDHQNNFVLEETADNSVTITMGYIQPACYSSNNFWAKGMLCWDPYNEETMKNYHLIQGYSVLDLSLNNDNNPFKVTHWTNYEKWKDLYKEALDLVKDSRGEYKPAWDFENNKSTFPNDPNDPLTGGPVNI